MSCLLLTTDLMTSSRVSGAAGPLGVTVKLVHGPPALVEQLAEGEARLVMIDLTTPGLDLEALATQARAAATGPVTLLAFGPHVHLEKLAAARAAGCDEVISRGEFYTRLGALLAKHAEA